MSSLPAFIDLNPFQLQRPEKLVWSYPQGVTEPLDQLKSSSLRKFLAKAEVSLSDAHITWTIEPVTEASFTEWLTYYQSKMEENEFSTIADLGWYQKRLSEGYQIFGLWFKKAGQLVASGILRIKDTEEIVLAFKASDRLELGGKANSSIGAVVDFCFLQYAVEQGFERISAGRSRNAFGVINSLGYLDFKLRLGYQQNPDPASPLLNQVPIDEQGRALFLAATISDPMTFAWYEINPTGEPWAASRIPSLREPINLLVTPSSAGSI